MNVLTDAKSIRGELLRLLKSYPEYRFSVAWASKHPVFDELAKRRGNIRRFVVGTDFWQTDPKVLQTFKDDPAVRMVQPGGSGTFHPKVYLFSDPSAERWACLIGSPNFTGAALSVNDEAAILVTEKDDPEGTELQRIRRMLESYWRLGVAITSDALEHYKRLWFARHAKLEKLRNLPKDQGSKVANQSPLLDMEWPKFAAKVRADIHFPRRIALLRAARQKFASHVRFADMDDLDRKKLAGTLVEGELDRMSDGTDWGLFGAMSGAGRFKSLVLRNSKLLSKALDCIPATGEVEQRDYDAFVDAYSRAFAPGKGSGIATATRLVAMKRPDVFVCLDQWNRTGLCRDLGVAPTTLGLGEYWDAIVVPVHDARWWTHPAPPSGTKRDIWEGRVALLDALYYEDA